MIKGTRLEIEYLFRSARFSHEQIENIGHVCRVLGRYMFVDRDLLQARAGKKIGLSIIKKCAKNNIITELQHQDEKDKRFYYQLGMGGMYLLEKAGEGFIEMNILADHRAKSRILTFNHFALDKGYDIALNISQDNKHRYFMCKKNIVCYFPKVIKEMEILKRFQQMFKVKVDGGFEYPTIEELRDKFNFMPVENNLTDVGLKTRSSTMVGDEVY